MSNQGKKFNSLILPGISSLALAVGSASGAVADEDQDQVKLGTIGNSLVTVDIVAQRDSIQAVTPVQATLEATQPQSVISRAYIEDQVPATGNFNSIVGVAPSVVTQPSPNGPGLSDTKSTMRGFHDNQYNVTWDGVPFGDTNDPSHHSTSYFPSSVIGGVVVERGPGNASNMGQATFGGSINLFSKTPSDKRYAEIYESRGTWNTNLTGVAFESGKMESLGGATLQFNWQKLTTDGYLKYNDLDAQNFMAKFQAKVGSGTTLTVFSTLNNEVLHLPDNAIGPTAKQLLQNDLSYGGLNNDPNSMGYWKYNHIRKSTDMEYIRLQTDWGNGWNTDNDLYTYAYHNLTFAGDAPDQYGTATLCNANGKILEPEVCAGHKGSAKGDVPGNDKLNEYRVQGDIFKASYQTSYGLLRAGFWAEASHTHRHKYYMDLTTNTYTGAVKNDQGSSWSNYQPFVEFEWKPAESLTVTPGLKYVNFTRTLAAINNNGYGPYYGDYRFTDTLPFLTINKRLGEHDSLYAQYARGFQIPTLDVTYVAKPTNTPQPQTTTNYQIGYVHSDKRLTFDADFYRIVFNNLILSQPGVGSQVGSTFFINAGGATYQGFEAELSYLIGGGLSVFVNGSINDAKFTDVNAALEALDKVSGAFTANGSPANGRIPNAPDSTLATGLVYRQGPISAAVNYVRTGKQYAAPGEPAAYEIPAYDNVDLTASYTWTNLGLGIESLKLQGSVYNLTDKRNLTLIAVGPPDEFNHQAPRSYMLTARVRF